MVDDRAAAGVGRRFVVHGAGAPGQSLQAAARFLSWLHGTCLDPIGAADRRAGETPGCVPSVVVFRPIRSFCAGRRRRRRGRSVACYAEPRPGVELLGGITPLAARMRVVSSTVCAWPGPDEPTRRRRGGARGDADLGRGDASPLCAGWRDRRQVRRARACRWYRRDRPSPAVPGAEKGGDTTEVGNAVERDR